MAKTTFSAYTVAKSAEVDANFEGAYDGTFDYDRNSLRKFRSALINYVHSGLTFSTSATLNASFVAGAVVINGYYLDVSAGSHTYTASKDTYVDIKYTAVTDTTGTVVYTEVANNAASPTITANGDATSGIRVAIVISSGTAVTTVNQGDPAAVLPIASSIAYSVTDSLGNMICNRNPTPGIIGYRQVTANQSTSSASFVQVTGLTAPVIVPAGRRVKVTGSMLGYNSTGSEGYNIAIFDGSIGGGGTQLSTGGIERNSLATATNGVTFALQSVSGAKTYNLGYKVFSGGTAQTNATSVSPSIIMVELV